MVEAENLIFEGEYSFPKLENLEKSYQLITRLLEDYLLNQDYIHYGKMPQFLMLNRYFYLKFVRNVPESDNLPIKYKFKKAMGQKNSISKYNFEKWINSTRIDLPFFIEIRISFRDGIYNLKVISKPLCYQMIATGYLKLSGIGRSQYSIIKAENVHFIKEIMSAIGATEIKEPTALNSSVRFRLSDKLDSLGLTHISNLMDKGLTRINNGEIENGLSDLRVALEKFVPESVKLIGETPEVKIKENLKILKNKGYLNDRLLELLEKTLYDFLYGYLSDIPSHNRDKSNLLNEFDALYAFSLFEVSMEYILQKILKRV